MNHQLINSLLLAGLLVVAALACLTAATGTVKNVQNVLNKLDAYAIRSSSPSSKLTIQELEDAYAEFTSWDEAQRQQVIRYSPLMQLLADFLFYPMERFHDLISDSPEEHEAYIRRLELNYKRFRSSYLGKIIGRFAATSPKTDKLVYSLFEIKNPQPLTMKLLREAKQEYVAFTQKIREIPEFEDIYASLDELERYRNYQARPEVQGLASFVFPLAEKVTEEQLPALKSLYVTEMGKKNYGVHEGELVRFEYH